PSIGVAPLRGDRNTMLNAVQPIGRYWRRWTAAAGPPRPGRGGRRANLPRSARRAPGRRPATACRARVAPLVADSARRSPARRGGCAVAAVGSPEGAIEEPEGGAASESATRYSAGPRQPSGDGVPRDACRGPAEYFVADSLAA